MFAEFLRFTCGTTFRHVLLEDVVATAYALVLFATYVDEAGLEEWRGTFIGGGGTTRTFRFEKWSSFANNTF